jgi:hypothetical protein
LEADLVNRGERENVVSLRRRIKNLSDELGEVDLERHHVVPKRLCYREHVDPSEPWIIAVVGKVTHAAAHLARFQSFGDRRDLHDYSACMGRMVVEERELLEEVISDERIMVAIGGTGTRVKFY